jgi:hypothetical protein
MKRVQTTHPQSNDNDGLLACRAPHCHPAPTALLSLRVVVWAGPGQLQHISFHECRVQYKFFSRRYPCGGLGVSIGATALMCEDDV